MTGHALLLCGICLCLAFIHANTDENQFNGVNSNINGHVDLNDSHYATISGRTYYFQLEGLWITWPMAQTFCESISMSLVSFETQQESDDVTKYMHENILPYFYYWMSGTRDANTEHWYWASTGQNFTYDLWGDAYPREPIKYSSCSMMQVLNDGSTYWGDFPCNHNEFAFCEQRD